MRVVIQILSIGFISLYSSIGHAMCAVYLRDQHKLDRQTPRENLATVKKVFFHLLMAEVNENGKKVGIVILPDDPADKVGRVWAEHGIGEDAKLLVDWMPASLRTHSASLPILGAAPAKIAIILNDHLTLQGQVDGEPFELTADISKVVNRGQPFSSLGLEVDTWVWVRWDPKTKVVESIVP